MVFLHLQNMFAALKEQKRKTKEQIYIMTRIIREVRCTDDSKNSTIISKRMNQRDTRKRKTFRQSRTDFRKTN